jgi:hypothetical protein
MIVGMEPDCLAQPKRNSGRTGRRRMTEAEAAFRGPEALRKHRARHGRPVGPGNPMPDPPEWFSPALLAIWHETLATAPARRLHAADRARLIVLVVAVHQHHTASATWLSYQMTEPPIPAPAEVERRMRTAAALVLQASEIMGLSWRAREGTLPAAPDAAVEENPHMRFRLIKA